MEVEMEFKNIENSICDCTQDAEEDIESQFALKINGEKLKNNSFKTSWERGKRPSDENECKSLCSFKSQSLSIVRNEDEETKVLSLYKDIFSLAPQYRNHCALIKFEENCGLLKSTPTRRNSLHYDFYKSDSFSAKNVILIKLIPLSDV